MIFSENRWPLFGIMRRRRYVSTPRRFGKQGKGAEDQRLAVEIVFVNLPGLSIEHFPGVGGTCQPRGVARVVKLRAEPAAHSVDEIGKRHLIGPSQTVAER